MTETKFKVEYTWDKKELVDRIESTLLNEGWNKTNYTYPVSEDRIKPNDVFVSWFERVWK